MTVANPARAAADFNGRRSASGRRSTLIVVYLSLGGLAFSVLQSLVAPALGTIARDLSASTSETSWVLTAYLLSASVLTPVLGRLGDMVGKRQILIVVLAVLLAGTVLAALASNLGVLIAARVLQGAAGSVMPLSIGIVRDELPRERVSVTIGLLSATFGVGGGIGIAAAGPIVQSLNWHWLFWSPTVLIVIALLGAVFGMPESSVRKPGRLDILGSVILSAALASILLAVSNGRNWGWESDRTLGLLALGVIALVAFVLVELRVREPLVDLRLFTIRGVWTAHLVALVIGFAMFAVFVLIPPLLELPNNAGYGFGMTVTQAGLLLLPTVIAMVALGPMAGVLVRTRGAKLPMLLGSILVAAAFGLPAIAHDRLWQIVVSGILVGAGIGLALAATANAIIDAVPSTQSGEAISANAIARTVGSSIGTAAIATLLTAHISAPGVPSDGGFTIAFWTGAAVTLVAVLAVLAAPSVRRTPRR
ncbi:MFS transporter [Dactylosporangium sp. CA-092794]|uniref:MFS transporter n=1 Tax=Dactylosporangium sp. CA-092794 TaxID=3239929 RepID=UPI003D8D638C